MSEKKGGVGGMLKLGLILALYAAVACVGLAFVYAGTAKVISRHQEEDLAASLKELFPDADNFEQVTGIKSPNQAVSFEEGGSFAALKNGETIGLALKVSRASYGGAIKTIVGVGTDEKISRVKILEHNDTPGLGANAASSSYYVDRANGIRFYDQFAGKKVSDSFVPKQDVIAITAATVTSRAVAESVKAAGEAACAWLASNVQGASR